MSLHPIKKEEIEVGSPLPWSIFDEKKNLLLKEGFVIESEAQLDALLEGGIFRSGAKHKVERAIESIGFSSINLQIGELLQLQLSQDPSGNRYHVKLIGYLEKRSLLVTAPVFNESVILLRVGQSAVLRCFSGKNAYAFSSTALRVCSTPYPYLHLSYPTSIQGMEVRKSTRVKTNVIGSVWRDENPETKIACTIDDISFTGAKINTSTPLGKAGDALKLYFRIVSHGATVYISPSVEIKSVLIDPSESDDKSSYHYGVEFKNLDQSESFALQVLVYQNLFEIS